MAKIIDFKTKQPVELEYLRMPLDFLLDEVTYFKVAMGTETPSKDLFLKGLELFSAINVKTSSIELRLNCYEAIRCLELELAKVQNVQV